MPIVQENPTYFSDNVPEQPTMDPAEFYSNDSSIRRHNAFGGSSLAESTKITSFTPKSKPRGRTKLPSTDDSELEVFLSSCESNTSYSTFSESSNDEMSKKGASKTNHSNFSKGLGLGQKLGQFFWSKSKSKTSLGTQSEESSSTSGVGSSSSRCTPDSSICTSSLESHSGNENVLQEGNVTLMADQTALYRFDDCERYAANMYYNCSISGGDSTSYTLRMKPRNYSVPMEGNSLGTKCRNNEIEDCVEPYYNNMTFSTFPNPRRHSIAASSISNSSRARKNKLTNCELDEVIEQDRDGYLRPKEPHNFRNNLSHQQQAYYINEPGGSNNSGNTSRVQVQVDVHHGSPKVSSLKRPSSSEEEFLDETSATTLTATTENSQASTVVAWTGPSLEASWKKHTNDPPPRPDNEWKKKHHGTIHPMYLGRSGNDCEPYCSLCTSPAMKAANSRRSKMDVAIVSCQECFFSKEAEGVIRTFFDKLVTADKQKLDVTLQSYDLKELDRTSVATSVHRAKVQIVIISHLFLQRLKQEAFTRVKISPINRVFRSKRVIAVLFGVTMTEISEGYEGVLARFSEWYCVELKSATKLDPEFCKRFTDQVVKIYNVELSNTNNFSVFPKKVTKDQGKFVLTLKKPTEVGDEVRVEFACGRRKEMMTQVRMENPYQTSLRVPVNLSPDKTSLIEVMVYVNNHKLGATWLKYEAHAKYGDDDWIERMGNMVPGFFNLLDEHISQTLSKNFRECTDISTDPSMEIMNDVLVCKEDDFPTVLHFAAYYGLRLTAYTVLSEADGLEQCQVKNEMDESPFDVAKMKGHETITKLIEEYECVNDSWKALKILQDMIGRSSVSSDIETQEVGKLHTSPKGPSVRQSREINPTQLDYVNITPNYENDDASQFNGNSDGSYVDIVKDLSSEIYSEPSAQQGPTDPMLSYDFPPTPIPIPRSKSPRRKSYVNIKDSSSEKSNEVSDSPSEKNNDVSANASGSSDESGTAVHRRVKSTKPKVDSSKRRSMDASQYINIMEDWNGSESGGISDYSTPRPLNQDYQIPPRVAKPVYPEPHESIQDSISEDEQSPISSPVLKTNVELIPKDTGGYWIIDSDQEEGKDKTPSGSQKDLKQEDVQRSLSSPEAIPHETKLFDSSKRLMEVPPFVDQCDLDLIQLMEDFKRDGWSLQQIELLFEHWKSRPDVQDSFEQKKENLRKIREDYKKIQGKRTFFDKVVGIVLGRKRSRVLTSSPSLPSPPPILVDNQSPTKSESPILSRPDLRYLSKSRSTDMESETSHEGKSVSECGSDSTLDSRPALYSNPLNTRFKDSYISPDGMDGSFLHSPPSPATGEKPFFVDPSKAVYDQPPPPRPVESPTASNVSSAPPSPGPPVPKPQPVKRGITNGTPPVVTAPPLPEKPSHMKYKGETNLSQSPLEEEDPPPPPLRSYKPPNVFNYIDYKKKEK